MPWHEDEQDDQTHPNENSEKQDHHCTLVHEFPYIGFSDAGPIHEGVLAEAG